MSIKCLLWDYVLDEGTFEVTCDECGDSVEVEAAAFRDVVDEIKSEGWRITKEGGEWVHLCPDCR